MRSATARALVGAVVVALVAGSSVAALRLQDGSATPGPAAASSAPAPAPAPSPTAVLPPAVRPALLPPLPSDAPDPLAAALAAAATRARTEPALAPGLAVSVVDVATAAPLLQQQADRMLVPASTAKIVTAVATLLAVPADTRLTTRVVGGSAPGEVVLVGGGDPTLAGPRAPTQYPAPARLSDLARRTRLALGPTPVTRVLVDESRYTGPRLGPGWVPGYVTQGAVAPVGPLMVDAGRVRPDRSARVADPALAAGRAFASLLQPGTDVAVARGTAAPGVAPLAQVTSPPVPLLVERMLTRSDNDLAEALAREVAIVRGQPPSFAGAATATRAVLAGLPAEVGPAPGSVALVDGSGLSRQNRLQPSAVTRLLVLVAGDRDPRLSPVLSGLPVAGFDGTLARRYRGRGAAAAAGSVRAKTGTLDGVSALAGLVRTTDGRLLAFDLTADSVPLGARVRAEAALDGLAAALAACGCRGRG